MGLFTTDPDKKEEKILHKEAKHDEKQVHQALKDLSIAQKEEQKLAKKEHSGTHELEKALQAEEKARIHLNKAEAELKSCSIRVEQARREAEELTAAHQRAIAETQSAKQRLDEVQNTYNEKKEERNERLAALGSRNISPTSSNNSSTVGVNRSASQRYASGSSLGAGAGGAAIGRSVSTSSSASHRVAAPAFGGEQVQSPVQASPISQGGDVRRVAAPEYGAPSPVGAQAGGMGLSERAAHDHAAAQQGYAPQQHVPQIQEPVPHGRPVPATPDVEPRTVKSHPPIIGAGAGPQSHPPIIGAGSQGFQQQAATQALEQQGPGVVNTSAPQMY